MPNKIDSNTTGLRYAEESSLGVLPVTPDWYPLEPNSYNDFGGQVALTARNPIESSRQRKKGVVTDLDASGGFNHDLTQDGLIDILQGFFFASWRKKAEVAALTGVTTGPNTYTKASGLNVYYAGDSVFAEGFTNAANNGLKDVTTAVAATLTVSQTLAAETPPATAKLTRVGFKFGSAEVDITTVGGYKRLARVGGTKDLTQFGLIPGEWVIINSDTVGERFNTAGNNCWARVRAVAATYIEFDKASATMADEVGTGKTIRIWFGNVLKNESLVANQVRRSYNLERTLGNDGSGTQSEYLEGSVPNQLALQIQTAAKVTADLSFMSTTFTQRTGATGVKAGNRPSLVTGDVFNTVSDFSLLKLHIVGSATPLFAFITEASLTLNNNLTANKAVGVLGAFDITAGNFEVGGSLTAYFSDVTAVQSIKNNSDVAFYLALVKNNKGILLDMPYLALGDGRASVEKDQPITLPLTMAAAADPNFDHTLLMMNFRYLPNVADI